MSSDDKEMDIWLNLLCRRSPSSDDHWDCRDAAVFWRGASLIMPPHLTNLSQFPLCLRVDIHLVALMMVMLLSSVSPNMVPGNSSSTSSSQPVTERSGNRTCREGMNLGNNHSTKLDLCRLDHPSTV